MTTRRAGGASAASLSALVRTQEVLLAPHAFTDDLTWRSHLAEEVRALFGADYALVLLPGAVHPYVGSGFDGTTLDAMAAFHPPPGRSAAQRVVYRDVRLARLHAGRQEVAGSAGDSVVFTRRGNEAMMGCSMEGTAMFDAVCRPVGIADFHGVFAHTPLGDAMLFVAHGRHVGRGTCIGEDAVPLLRVLAPGVAVLPRLLGFGVDAETRAVAHASLGAPELPDVTVLRASFGLTPREADVALGLARGWTRRQIAAACGVSSATVRHHTEAVFRKLGVARRGAVALALLAGRADRRSGADFRIAHERAGK